MASAGISRVVDAGANDLAGPDSADLDGDGDMAEQEQRRSNDEAAAGTRWIRVRFSQHGVVLSRGPLASAFAHGPHAPMTTSKSRRFTTGRPSIGARTIVGQQDVQIIIVHNTIPAQIPRALLWRLRAVAPVLCEDYQIQVVYNAVVVEVPRA
jgi:hypothetical protein